MKRVRFSLPAMLVAVVLLAGFSFLRTADAPAPRDGERAVYKIDRVHSWIGFKVRHLGVSNVQGQFRDYDAAVEMEGDDLSTLQADVTIDVASVDTGVERRDNDLRSERFFDAENYPTITFASKAVRNIDGETFELVGDLTIKDVTKEVTLDAEYLGRARMGDSERVGFSAETKINRKDFHLNFDRLTEAGGFVVGHDVRIILEIEAVRQ